MTARTTSRLPQCALLGLLASLAPGLASGAVITVASNATDWRQSTDVDSTSSMDFPWLGPAFLPDVSTYTLVPTEGWVAPTGVNGAAGLVVGEHVTFFRTSFNLPTFSTLTIDLQASFDNDLDIFFNGQELALEGDFSLNNFGATHRLFVAADGAVTNGYLGEWPFSTRVAASFPATIFNAGGTNELVVALRNIGNDAGGLAFRADFTTDSAPSAVPEPASLTLLGVGVIAVVGCRMRRRR